MTVDGERYGLLSGSDKISIEETGLSTSWLDLRKDGSPPLHPMALELLPLRLRAMISLFSPAFDSVVAISDQLPDDISPEPKFALLRLGGSEIPEVGTVLHDSGSGQLRWGGPRSVECSEGAG